jgi:hypothetical protein
MGAPPGIPRIIFADFFEIHLLSSSKRHFSPFFSRNQPRMKLSARKMFREGKVYRVLFVERYLTAL